MVPFAPLPTRHLRDANERYISTHFGNSDSFVILMWVKVIKNRTMTPDFSSTGVVLYEWPTGHRFMITTGLGSG